MINKEQLKQIISDLKEVTEGYVEPKVIFQEACSYQRGLMVGESRVSNYQNTKKDLPQAPNQEFKGKLASDKQKSLMKTLKIPFTDKTSISEAKELIEIKLGKKQEKYKEY